METIRGMLGDDKARFVERLSPEAHLALLEEAANEGDAATVRALLRHRPGGSRGAVKVLETAVLRGQVAVVDELRHVAPHDRLDALIAAAREPAVAGLLLASRVTHLAMHLDGVALGLAGQERYQAGLRRAFETLDAAEHPAARGMALVAAATEHCAVVVARLVAGGVAPDWARKALEAAEARKRLDNAPEYPWSRARTNGHADVVRVLRAPRAEAQKLLCGLELVLMARQLNADAVAACVAKGPPGHEWLTRARQAAADSMREADGWIRQFDPELRREIHDMHRACIDALK